MWAEVMRGTGPTFSARASFLSTNQEAPHLSNSYGWLSHALFEAVYSYQRLSSPPSTYRRTCLTALEGNLRRMGMGMGTGMGTGM